MTFLDAHLDQIELCSQTIADLPFPPPKKFTNALLACPDITTLIRDTDAHERALFTLSAASESRFEKNRRTTAFTSAEAQYKAARRQTAVAAVLGGDLAEKIRQERAREARSARRNQDKQIDDVDIEILLQGAEKLCGVYPVPGAVNRIVALRARNNKALASIRKYEEMATDQIARLTQMDQSTSFMPDDEESDVTILRIDPVSSRSNLPMTAEEFRREEEDVAELERKKKMLEERVNSMEKDLGGLMR